MNKQLFRAHMALNGDNQKMLAKAIGMPESTLSSRINGITEFGKDEINLIRKRYHLTDELTILIFVTDEVSKNDTTTGA